MNPATDYDLGLVRDVFTEELAGFTIYASLTRWGGLAVMAYATGETFPAWQGDNILEARAWAAQQQEKAV